MAMQEQFNPYYHWLGIPPEEQPPHFYRLLAVQPFEQNPAAIQGAADHWLAQLQPYRQGPYGPYAERLLAEIWNARQCLLDPRSKAGYDAQLYQALQARAAAEQDLAIDANLIGLHSTPPPLRRRTPGWQQALVVVVALAACVVAVVLVIFAMRAVTDAETARQVVQEEELRKATENSSAAEPRNVTTTPSAIALKFVPGAAAEPLGGKFDLSAALAVTGTLADKGGGFSGRAAADSAGPAADTAAKAAPPPVKVVRKAAPDEAAFTAATNALKESYAKELARTESISRIALAAQWIEKARTLREKPTEQYTMLVRARDLAVREDQCQLALLAIDELSRDFEVSSPDLKAEVLAQLGRPARSVSSFLTLLDAGAQVGRESYGTPAFEKLLAAVRTWDLGALRKASPTLAQGLADLRKRLDELTPLSQQTIEASSANTPAALWEQALAASVFREDWEQALPLLARTQHPELSKAAAGVVAEPKNARAFLALADAWWTLSEAERNTAVVKPRMQQAARYWYEKALPRLVEEDLSRARERVLIANGATPSGKHQPLTLQLNGLVGQVSVAPLKATGAAETPGKFAIFTNMAYVEYPQLPTSTYVHELELTFNGGGSTFSIRYGDPCQGISLDFTPSADGDYQGKLTHYTPKTSKSFKTQSFQSGTKISVTVYVNESRQSAWNAKREFSDTAAAPADLALHISNKGKSSVTIAKCELRPFEAGDADALRWPRPVAKGSGRGEEAALRWYSRNMGLTERPALNTPTAFVVATTGTPMQWIPPGAVKHVNYGEQPEERLEPTRLNVPRGFWLGRCEITQREWLALMPHNPGRIVGSPFYPVDGVSWEEAQAFCNLVTQVESRNRRLPQGYVYRLPTEAEWEVACLTDAKDEYGVESAGFWCVDTSDWRLHEAGEGKPNALGLYDMHGNIAEWCLDAWQDSPLLPPQALTDPFFHSPDPKNVFYVLRGGGWWSLRRDCSGSVRQQFCSVPGGHRGFRMALAPAR